MQIWMMASPPCEAPCSNEQLHPQNMLSSLSLRQVSSVFARIPLFSALGLCTLYLGLLSYLVNFVIFSKFYSGAQRP